MKIYLKDLLEIKEILKKEFKEFRIYATSVLKFDVDVEENGLLITENCVYPVAGISNENLVVSIMIYNSLFNTDFQTDFFLNEFDMSCFNPNDILSIIRNFNNNTIYDLTRNN